MKRFAFLAVILFSTYGLTSAQNDKKPEFFAGYSFESVNSGITSSDLQAPRKRALIIASTLKVLTCQEQRISRGIWG